ncbi:C-type lectin domain family 4 member A-like [Podarcis raffonei]|uniref:C-type lectin domain family 4 member A-like n=1 Tax=Podarcis raffonei TaxID=65483 RepID=UPI0023298621|nr:C-type lectin domain family 4 member A-like [Podarcis raffonei]
MPAVDKKAKKGGAEAKKGGKKGEEGEGEGEEVEEEVEGEEKELTEEEKDQREKEEAIQKIKRGATNTFWLCLLMIIGSSVLYHNYEQRVLRLSDNIDAAKTIRVFFVSHNQTLDALNDTEILGLAENLAGFLRDIKTRTTAVNVAIDNIIKLINGGWQPFKGRLFYLISHPMGFDFAQSECEKLRTILPTIVTKEEELFIETIAKESSKGVWIGLKKDGLTWRWLDGTPYNANSSYWNELSKIPGPVLEECVEVLNECNTPGLCWEDADCTDQRSPVCVMFPDSIYLP